MQMKEILNSLQDMQVEELQKLESIISAMITLRKDIMDMGEGRIVKLHQGKKQPIIVFDENNRVIKEFTGFTKCSDWIKEELNEVNVHNKLRKALNEGTSIQGYRFALQQRRH